MNHKVRQVIISHKDRLSRIGFELFKDLFKEFGTEILVINELERDISRDYFVVTVVSNVNVFKKKKGVC